MKTRFTELIGCRLPFQLAVLGGVGTPELAAAVAGAGGLGMVSASAGLPATASGPIGVGFLIPYLPSLAEIAAQSRGARVVEFFFGEPDPNLVAVGHSIGALVSWQIGSAAEAQVAEAVGCDLVVAQGVEAGGHVRGTQPLDELLPAVLAAVELPVVAAGGIGSADRVAEVIAAGADAVRVGTRFLASPECNSHPDYVRALLRATAEDTILTDHFDANGHWPARVRVLRSSLEAAQRSGNRAITPPYGGTDGDPQAMASYAGLSVANLQEALPAADVVRELTSRLI